MIANESEALSWSKFRARVDVTVEKLADIRGRHLLIPATWGLDFFATLIAAIEQGVSFSPIADLQQGTEKAEHVLGCTFHKNANGFVLSDGTFPANTCILFTSGSSGISKGVVHDTMSLLGNARSVVETINLGAYRQFLVCQQYHYTSAICHFLAAYELKTNLYISGKGSLAKEYISMVNSIRPDFCGGSPLQMMWMAKSTLDVAASPHGFFSSGDDLPSGVVEALLNRFPDSHVYAAYGMTEVGGRGCIHAVQRGQKTASVGRAIRGLNVRLEGTDENGVGEVVFSGNYLMKGLYVESQYTQYKQQAHEVLSGDVGYLDEDGDLNLIGRSDDVYKVSGKKVSGVVIARALKRLAGVSDVHVAFERDDLVGHVPNAYIVLGSPHTRADVIRHLRKELPANHVPKRIFVVDSIPRSSAGKVVRQKFENLLKGARPLT